MDALDPEEAPLPVVPASDAPDAIRARIEAVSQRINRDYMVLARDLWSVYSRGLYKDWGYESYDDYVVRGAQITEDKARRLRLLWSRLVLGARVPPSQLADIKYNHALVLSRVVTPETAREWLVAGRELSLQDLRLRVEQARRPTAPPGRHDPAPAPPEPVRLAPPADQAVPPNAGADSAPPSPSAQAPAPAPAPAEAAVRRTYYLVPEQATVVDEAIAEANRTSPSTKEGYLLSCVALEFLANRLTRESDPDGRLRFFMRHLERVYGGKLLLVRSVAGFDLLRSVIDQHPEHFSTGATPCPPTTPPPATPPPPPSAGAGPAPPLAASASSPT